ncbi:A-kinase anchor protein 12 isoform X1 [Lemur catta]|uniref:A-kinase anchor protein 12 isoform X1 n=1 Tax=Lemur catta TaxID=9447 RepID=UPI001E26C52C|nr:A-kinase anchor protein 12 isoform X1 [Lemur catta]
MGAGSSTEQQSPEQPQAGSATPAEPEPSGGGPSAEAAPDTPGDPAVAAADPASKLLQKNGQLSAVNGLPEPGEVSLQEEALNGQEEEVVVLDVGQRDTEDVSERDSNKEMAANSAVVPDITSDGQEMSEIIEQVPSSESNLEELTQPTESQANDVGFKKVFKFVGLKFTVKKDKSEKSDTVQLLTVKKEEGEGAAGAGDHPEPSREAGEATAKDSELQQSTEKPEEALKHEQSHPEIPLQADSAQAAEEGKDEGEDKQEKEPSKSPESPTSPVTSETASSFKKFFTQGWAGWRKKTSFRKPKEDELEASEKKEPEPEKADTEDKEKAEDSSGQPTACDQPPPQEPTGGVQEARLSAEYEKVELPSEDQVGGLQASPEEKLAPLATEVFDDKVEVHQEVVADVHVSTAEEAEEQKAEVEEMVESLPPEKLVETDVEPQEAEPAKDLVKTKEAYAPGGDHIQGPELSPDDKVLPKHPEGVVSEVEMLSSQERMKVQGSPLKKLFTSTGLKKLSGKKQKGKRGGGGDEESGEHGQLPIDSPDSNDEQKGESSASSPEEPEEITCLEKGMADAHQDGEVEEGTTSDGEKKREGVTPWASFKKMVTPKKRVRRPSESDKEDELDKVKSATLSSTESAASEMQEEVKGSAEEPKPEEPKRKVDTSVSWEALICVGSSKKRARKGSSSDEEGGPKTVGGDSQKAEEAGKDKETGADAVLASSQEHDPARGSSSPEQAGSPSEGEGVSTWESFKRLVTARKRSKSKLEEKNEDSATGTGVEHSASDAEPGKEESWVSIKKFIPGRRKKRPDGKQEQAVIEDTGPPEVNEDDADVPAVVPLSEYDAVEREKMEAQQAQKSAEKPEQMAAVCVCEELSQTPVHAVAVAVVDGTRAVTNVEERSPSWISASVTEPLEQAEEDEATSSAREVSEREVIAEETPTVTKPVPENRDARDNTIVSEVQLTSEDVPAAETTEAFCAEEATEASGAEETTEMVSAVSQLTDSPDTTEEATPVQEVEGGVLDVEEQERRTQEILQAVAEKVKEESQLHGTSGPEGTVQTMQRVESEPPEKLEEAEEGPKRDTDVVLQVHGQQTKTEHFTQGKVMVQATPESSEEAPQVTESVESSELITTCQAETLAGVKSQEITVEQAIPPDSVETHTDSETNGSTPVADIEALDTTQQDKIVEIHTDNEVASGPQSAVTEAESVPAQKEKLPAPSSFQSQEENEEQSKVKDVPEHPDKAPSVETVPILSKTEVIQEAGRCADEETKDIPSVEGLEVSVDTDAPVSQDKVTEVAPKSEVTTEAECQKNGNIEIQSPTKSPPSPVEREVVVQVEREKIKEEPAQVSEEKLEQETGVTVSDKLSRQLVQTVNVTIIDREKEVSSLEGSPPPCPGQEEAVCTEVQVQSSEASLLALTAAVVEEKVLGEAVKILETGETLESAGAHLLLEEKPSEKDEDFTAQPGEEAEPTGPESQAESVPVPASATCEKAFCSVLEGEKTPSQKWKSDEVSEQVVHQEVKVSVAREEDVKADSEILEFETESSKLVQSIIQTAVDQFVRTEETTTEVFTSDLQTQAHAVKADSQAAGQKTETEDSEGEVSAPEIPMVAAKEEPELTAAGQVHSEISKDVSEASEKIIEVESSSVNDQQLEEIILPPEEEGDGTGRQSVPEGDGGAMLGERIEKSQSESKEDEEGDAVDYPESQDSALADAHASGGLTKESPDTNGPKRKEKEDAQEVEVPEGRVHSESDKEIRTQTQEEIRKEERERAKSELTES